jgi:thioester reductase-like protein
MTPSDAGSTGYSRSKWVGEAICAAAALKLPGRVNVLRIGQLTGSSDNGIWNISEAWPLMLFTVDALNCLPEIDEPLNWLPLDTAAIVVVDIAFQDNQNDNCPHVYHLVNNSSSTKWSDLLVWLGEIRSKPFETVSPTVWLDKLESYPKKHPAKNLLGFWRNAYDENYRGKTQHSKRHEAIFSTVEAQIMSVAMQNVRPVDHKLAKRIWHWLEDEIRTAKTQVYVSRNRFSSV